MVRYTAEELREMQARGESLTDWARVHAMTDEDIERLADEDDAALDAEARERAPRLVAIDQDVLSWYSKVGPAYEERINIVLRAFMNAWQASPLRLD